MAPTNTENGGEHENHTTPTKTVGAVLSAQELVKAQSHVIHLLTSHVGAMTLKCAIELRIPDIIHGYGRAVTLSELVSSLPIVPKRAPYVQRIMRLLAHLGFFEVDNDGSYSLTANSKILLMDTPVSFAPWVLGIRHHHLTAPWQLMSAWLQQEGQQLSLFEMHHGKSMWGLANENPGFNTLFNEAMASDTSVQMMAIVTAGAEAFRGLSSLVDVGGGNGAMARAIAEAFPQIKCTVYDLPHVIATAPDTKLVQAIGGDMFQYIPKAHAVFLKMIFHDWTDEDCVKILKLCKESIPSKEEGGKVIIVEVVVHSEGDDSTMTEVKLCFDMAMMMSTEGRERGEQEWKKIFGDAGFSDYKITPLGLRSLIEVFP